MRRSRGEKGFSGSVPKRISSGCIVARVVHEVLPPAAQQHPALDEAPGHEGPAVERVRVRLARSRAPPGVGWTRKKRRSEEITRIVEEQAAGESARA